MTWRWHNESVGVQTEVFKLFRYESTTPCGHDVLVRARQPGAANADQTACDAADAFADSAIDHLRGWWERWSLRRECVQQHTSHLIAQAAGIPIGEELLGSGLRPLRVWVAAAARGLPWAVIGTAVDEAAFWCEVREDPDALSLKPQAPVPFDVYFITDEDGRLHLSDS